MFFTQNILKEKMESTNTTDNNYGRQELPPVLKSGERLNKYWGYITSVFATDDFTLKEVFMGSAPFALAMLFALILIIIFPPISTYLLS